MKFIWNLTGYNHPALIDCFKDPKNLVSFFTFIYLFKATNQTMSICTYSLMYILSNALGTTCSSSLSGNIPFDRLAWTSSTRTSIGKCFGEHVKILFEISILIQIAPAGLKNVTTMGCGACAVEQAMKACFMAYRVRISRERNSQFYVPLSVSRDFLAEEESWTASITNRTWLMSG